MNLDRKIKALSDQAIHAEGEELERVLAELRQAMKSHFHQVRSRIRPLLSPADLRFSSVNSASNEDSRDSA